jgi:methylthioribose-1-phosphate isomerase
VPVETIVWQGGRPGFVRLLEQTLLPEKEVVIEVRTVEEMHDAIYRLAVRGAPAIGVAAAFGVLLGVQHIDDLDPSNVVGVARESASILSRSRPTAVNLFWALRRMIARAERDHARGASGDAIVDGLFAEALAIFDEDRAVCDKLGEVGSTLIRDGWTILTHCNAGALATAGAGTALAPIYRASAQKKHVKVFADETRPLLQGARLTAWELMQAGIDVTLITDNMAARVMFEGKIDAVFVGADRIARNGDVCNKIGTYGVAVLAREHRVPFYVVAPLSTFDPSIPDGSHIPIEERPAEEITRGFGRRTAPEGVKVYNPAFDVTPARLVTGIVTEVGVIESPDSAKVEAALKRGGILIEAHRDAPPARRAH